MIQETVATSLVYSYVRYFADEMINIKAISVEDMLALANDLFTEEFDSKIKLTFKASVVPKNTKKKTKAVLKTDKPSKPAEKKIRLKWKPYTNDDGELTAFEYTDGITTTDGGIPLRDPNTRELVCILLETGYRDVRYADREFLARYI
jgi:hypothetical protein